VLSQAAVYEILQQILNFFGHGFCHQLPERSLEAGGLYFCICARCTGIYLGFLVTLIVIAVLKPKTANQKWIFLIGALLIVPMAIDGAGSYLGLFDSTDLKRYITGYLCGMGLGVIASGGVLSLLPARGLGGRGGNTLGRLIALLLTSAAVGALFWIGYPYLGIAAPLISLASLWLSVSFVLLLIVSTTKLWTPSTPPARRAALVVLCLIAAVVVMAAFSLFASLVKDIFPWSVFR